MNRYELERDQHLQRYIARWSNFLGLLPQRDFRLDLSDYENTRYLSINYKIIPDGFELIATYRQRFLLDANVGDPKHNLRNRLLVSINDGIRANGPFIDTRTGTPQSLFIPVPRKGGLKSLARFEEEYLDIIDGSVTHALETLVRGHFILEQLNSLD